MPSAALSVVIPAPQQAVFELLHDYRRRREWDTLLDAAHLEPSGAAAGVGVVAVCRGRARVGGMTLRTRYITFRPPDVAAVLLEQPSGCFATFAAAIRHSAIEDGQSPPGGSLLTYRVRFSARPRCLRWLLEPLMQTIFIWETRRRLAALARALAPSRRATAGSPYDGT
jgi:hypothetical protein